MFSMSTQRRHWMFHSEEDIRQRRERSHLTSVETLRRKAGMSSEKRDAHYLTFAEAEALRTFFERKLLDFCAKFLPPMPKCVQGTAVQYYKRFYINNSVVDYHPKEILVTAAFLACKVEEFNVSMDQFLSNIKGDKERATGIVLNSELLLMKELQFHLTVHNPYRPMEGFLIDIKSRCQCLKDPDSLRKDIEKFLDEICFTDAFLIYAPSQIALAAIIHAASRNGEHMDTYVTDVLFSDVDQKKLVNIIEAVRNIRVLVKNIQPPIDTQTFLACQEKLERCRNQDNNPDSEVYKRKIQELLDDDEDRQQAKQMRVDSSDYGQLLDSST